MSKITRRSFVATASAGAGLSAIPFPIWFERYAAAQQAQPMVRRNVASQQGIAMLQKYAKAVKAMSALQAKQPRSWTWQWYTHAVRDNTTKAAQLKAVFGAASSPAKTFANQMWNTCQAHPTTPGAQEWYFLPWHRMYLYFFERICRQVINDNTFTLPYWNYSSPSAKPIPAQFRMKNNATFGPLFRSTRNPGINAGNPIDQGDPANTLGAASALSRPSYAGDTGFNQTLDFGLHGTVHVDIGNDQGMASIEWAANDPVFWVHHCNIDRLWASWNKAGRKNPTQAAWLNKTFTFADENGNMVSAKVSDFDTIEERGYTYDFFEPVPAPPAPAPSAAPMAAAAPQAESEQQPQRTTLATTVAAAAPAAAPSATPGAAAGGGIALGSGAVRVKLGSAAGPAAPSAAPGAAPAPAPLTERVDTLPPERRIYLIIRNYRASVRPGTLYHVYLEAPAGPAQAAQGHFVGAINFFGAVPHAGHEPDAAAAAEPSDVEPAISFDVTQLAARLKSEGRLTDAPTVTIVPKKTPNAKAKPIIGEIALVEE